VPIACGRVVEFIHAGARLPLALTRAILRRLEFHQAREWTAAFTPIGLSSQEKLEGTGSRPLVVNGLYFLVQSFPRCYHASRMPHGDAFLKATSFLESAVIENRIDHEFNPAWPLRTRKNHR
jgi:hypothetical protein